jgi:acetyl-CoA synthetase
MMQISSREEALEQALQWLEQYGGPDICLAELLCDRHAGDPEKVALVYEDAAGESTHTFAEMRDLSAKFAGVLRSLGVAKGDRVATLLPKTPELMIATLGLWRLGAVHVPLYTAFGPQAISFRVENSGASVIVTDTANRPNINTDDNVRIITVEDPKKPWKESGDIAFWDALKSAEPALERILVSGDDLMIVIYTSGTTGDPKGVETPVKALASFEVYMRFGLEARDDDVFWNMADPGWAYGLYYALAAPLLMGRPTLYINVPSTVKTVYSMLRKYAVTNIATAPTIFRMLRAAGAPEGAMDGINLRVASCAGEPLNPDVGDWATEHLGIPIHDQYGQTEIGMVAVNHHLPALERPLKPGSMGHAMPGFHPVVLDESGAELGPGEDGQMALDISKSPLYWFRGYYNDPDRTAGRIIGNGRYYITGDTVRMDRDGYFFFSGRDDDIISSSAHRIGPFEIESALMGHDAVAEAAVVGKPDSLRGEIVKAFVVLKEGFKPSKNLANEICQFVRSNLSSHAYPREAEFVKQLPKTPSGKIQRFLLREK